MSAEEAAGDDVVQRAAAGARLLTARGAGMRLVSVASNLALLVLVTPAELGLLAVVRGIAGFAGDTSDLGFAWALLRRRDTPSREEYGALAGVQLSLVFIFLGLGLLAPSVIGIGGASGPTWGRWVFPMLLTMLTVPLGTGARIRIEREMNYQRIAFADISAVVLTNLLLLGFAITHHFAIGVFVTTGGVILYNNLLLWFWSPGPLPAFRFPVWRRLSREFAGFTLGHVGSLMNGSATPILVASLFGLPVAGLWSFATRLGNVLQLAFEGFRRAAIPAAGKLVESPRALARLAQETMVGAARFTLPMIAAFCAILPLVGWLLPQWAPAVPLAQLYLVGFGLAGVLAASVVPASVALHGPRIVLAEQFAPIVAGWAVLGALALMHSTSIIVAVLPMQLAVITAVWTVADPSIRPRWSETLRLSAVALAATCAVVFVGEPIGAHPVFISASAAVAFLGVSALAFIPAPSRTAALPATPDAR